MATTEHESPVEGDDGPTPLWAWIVLVFAVGVIGGATLFYALDVTGHLAAVVIFGAGPSLTVLRDAVFRWAVRFVGGMASIFFAMVVLGGTASPDLAFFAAVIAAIVTVGGEVLAAAGRIAASRAGDRS